MATTANHRIEFNSTLLQGGAILAVLGSMLIALGIAFGGTALLTATRKWVRELDTPPSETARTMMHHLQAATSAGVKAWQEDGAAVGDQRAGAGIHSAA